MSDTDSFIDEVSEEVRRDRLFLLMKRYGWIAVLLVVLIVGGAAYNEWNKAQTRAAAENAGDTLLAALSNDEAAARVEALDEISLEGAGGQAIAGFLKANEQLGTGDTEAAATTLEAIANLADLPLIYKQIAGFKALLAQGDASPIDARRAGFEALVAPGSPLRLLAEEQLALIDVEAGEIDAAVARLQTIVTDAETTAGLRRRASQVIVALGREPEASVSDETAAQSGASDQ